MAEWQAPLGLPRTWGVLMEHRLTLWSPHGDGANSRHPRGRTLGDGLGHQQKEEMPIHSSVQAEVFKLLDNGEETWTPSEGTESTQGNNGDLESSEARVYLEWRYPTFQQLVWLYQYLSAEFQPCLKFHLVFCSGYRRFTHSTSMLIHF